MWWSARRSSGRTNGQNGRKSAPYSPSGTINCWRPQLVVDGEQLEVRSVIVVSFETFFSCLPSATSCGRQQPTALDELYGADLHSFGSFLRLLPIGLTPNGTTCRRSWGHGRRRRDPAGSGTLPSGCAAG